MPKHCDSGELPFWKRKKLAEMTRAEWESLCDGCARCCLHKLEDMDTGIVHYTNVACRLLDLETCHCTDYPNRSRRVDDCITLKAENIDDFQWLPSTCTYRLLAEAKDFPSWHPLAGGQPDSVHRAGISVRDIAVSEYDADDLEDHILDEPL